MQTPMAGTVALQATVYGRVQGVFFRSFVAEIALKLDLKGYVRNLPAGVVEVRAEGEKQQLEILLRYLHEGPTAARVDRVVTEWTEATGDYRGFAISR